MPFNAFEECKFAHPLYLGLRLPNKEKALLRREIGCSLLELHIVMKFVATTTKLFKKIFLTEFSKGQNTARTRDAKILFPG
jgi:hypothetical protein